MAATGAPSSCCHRCRRRRRWPHKLIDRRRTTSFERPSCGFQPNPMPRAIVIFIVTDGYQRTFQPSFFPSFFNRNQEGKKERNRNVFLAIILPLPRSCALDLHHLSIDIILNPNPFISNRMKSIAPVPALSLMNSHFSSRSPPFLRDLDSHLPRDFPSCSSLPLVWASFGFRSCLSYSTCHGSLIGCRPLNSSARPHTTLPSFYVSFELIPLDRRPR